MSQVIAFLCPRLGIKPHIVLDSLLDNTYLIENYEIRVVIKEVEGSSFGKLVEKPDNMELLKKRSIPWIKFSEEDSLHHLISDFIDPANIDFLVSCGWDERIPSDVIALSQIASLNCHSSYLPDYKGPSINVQWAHAETEGGATIHLLTDEFDEGRIICREKYRIGVLDSPRKMFQRVGELTAVLLREAILLLENDYSGMPNPDNGFYVSTQNNNIIAVISFGVVNRIARLFGLNPLLKFEKKQV